MRIILIIVISSFLYATPKRVTCYAKAGLGIFDIHGVHEGFGEDKAEAMKDAMADCRKAHMLIGCVPIPGCK